MEEIGVRELKEKASELLREVRENRETYAITYRGRIIARLVPEESEEEKRARALAALAKMDRAAKRISRHWPKGVSAVDAVAEQRR